MSAAVLFDTNVIGECGRTDGDPVIRDWVSDIDIDTIRVATISWGELTFGVSKLAEGRRRTVLTDWLGRMKTEFAPRTLPFDLESAVVWGEMRAQLRATGSERPGIDLQIAAIARRHGLAVATRNTRHFSGLGIDLIDPWAINGGQGGRKEQES